MGLKKYPIYNPIAYACIASIDFILKLGLSKRKKNVLPPQKFLICNGAHLGDVILTTSLLPALKEAYPGIKIGMAVGSWSLPVVQNHPLIDQVHVIDHWKQDRTKKGRYLKTRRQALKEIQSFQYDTAVDCCFHFPNFAPLLWQARIPVRIGFESAGLSPFLTHSYPWRPDNNVSAVHAYFSLLSQFPEINPAMLRPTLPLIPKIKRDPYLVIHMGSGSEKKEWTLSKWIDLTEKLLDDGHHLLFTGKGTKEYEHIEQVRSRFPQIKNQCNSLNWPEFVATIQNADLLIGVDTSAGHIAAATQTPAILLFTGVHPMNLWRPFFEKIHVITKQISCSPCFIGCESMTCIKEITVDEVYGKIVSFYKSRASKNVSPRTI